MRQAPTWPASLADIDPSQRHLTIALGVSLLLHAILLSIHFKLPDALDKAKERALDVILVNSRSLQKPKKVQARAQTALDGGGNTDEERRAKTPLPSSHADRPGNHFIDAQQRRVAELEKVQQQLLTRLKGQQTAVEADRAEERAPKPVPADNVSGLDLATHAMAIARLEGQIARNVEAYNQRPRKKFIGTRAEEYRFAQYVEDWRLKVERIGNLNYPESARGRLYGSLLLTVVIRADGSLDHVEVNRPSGHRVLDDTARRVVEMAAPYAPFPDAIRRDTDIIEITRTWTFTTADRLQSD